MMFIRKKAELEKDRYLCELIEIEVESGDGAVEIKQFAKRIGYSHWLMEYIEEEYEVIDNA